MAIIITRDTGENAKNAALTNEELDNNFININNSLVDITDNPALNFIHCTNNTGGTLTAGTVVMITGVINDQFTVSPAITTGVLDFELIIGVVAENSLPAATDTRVKVQGIVNNVNTSTWAEGAKLYVNPSISGRLTDIKPSEPNLTKIVAFVLKPSTSSNLDGSLYIKMIGV